MYKRHNVRVIYSTERGLSRSRNCALKNSRADIVVIADDDMRYADGYADIVLNAYNTHPDDDILIFQVNDRKKYFKNEKRINKILSQKISSVEITLKLNSINGIVFNKKFGAGSEYFQHGEESIFLIDCIKNRNNIKYIPLKIGSLVESGRPSTWFKGYNRQFFVDKGALYYQLSHYFFVPYILQFAIRKHCLYGNEVNFFAAIHAMMQGVREVVKLQNHPDIEGPQLVAV